MSIYYRHVGNYPLITRLVLRTMSSSPACHHLIQIEPNGWSLSHIKIGGGNSERSALLGVHIIQLGGG